jgi:hypothetical protein
MMPIFAPSLPPNHQRTPPLFALWITFHGFMVYLLRKKREDDSFVHFRFLRAQNATRATTAIITIAMIASSVVPNANPSVGSGSIGPPGDGAGPTRRPVAADELP